MAADRNPLSMIKPCRPIEGISAVLLPFASRTEIDWPAFEAHVARTTEAGLVPAVNMDTGYVQLLGDDDAARVLEITAGVTGGRFVAGAFVADAEGAAFDLDAYRTAAASIAERGGIPVVFPSWGLHAVSEDDWVDAHRAVGADLDRFIAFELGPQFVPYGRIVSLDAYRGLLDIPACIGAKHSSLRREPEWDRVVLRDAVRPEFRIYTGNDLAIDMVMYGSDYLLGLSTFAPDLFAARDRMWAEGHTSFYELNDALQYLGSFAFRHPTPAYRHDAAMFLELRGWAAGDATPDGAPRRPSSDRDVLRAIAERLGVL